MPSFLSKKVSLSDITNLCKKPFDAIITKVDAIKTQRFENLQAAQKNEELRAAGVLRTQIRQREARRVALHKRFIGAGGKTKNSETFREHIEQARKRASINDDSELSEIMRKVQERVSEALESKDSMRQIQTIRNLVGDIKDKTYGPMFSSLVEEAIEGGGGVPTKKKYTTELVYRFSVRPGKITAEFKKGIVWEEVDYWPLVGTSGGVRAYTYCYGYIKAHIKGSCQKNDKEGFPVLNATVLTTEFITNTGERYIALEPQNIAVLAGMRVTLQW